MMELEGIDIMFSNVETKPMPINDYREYIKEHKKELKDKAKGKKSNNLWFYFSLLVMLRR